MSEVQGWPSENDRLAIVAECERWSVAYRDPVLRWCAAVGSFDFANGDRLEHQLASAGDETIACAAAWQRLARFVGVAGPNSTPAAVAAVFRSQIRAIDQELVAMVTRKSSSPMCLAVAMAVMDGLGRARAELNELAYKTGTMSHRELI